MKTDRYLEVIKRFLHAEMYLRSHTPVSADDQRVAFTDDNPNAVAEN